VYTRPTYKRPYYFLHNVNRDLVRVTEGNENKTLDYTSHFYHGKSGYSIDQSGEDNCRVEENWKIPTDPYGSDVNTIDTIFEDKTECGENVIDGTT
jgi:hypothetical protein